MNDQDIIEAMHLIMDVKDVLHVEMKRAKTDGKTSLPFFVSAFITRNGTKFKIAKNENESGINRCTKKNRDKNIEQKLII